MSAFSNKSLSAKDIEEKIRNHPFPQEGYQPQRYDYSTKSYVDDGPFIEPYTVTMEDDDGDFGWEAFTEILDDYSVKSGEEKPFVDIDTVGRITLEKQFGGEGEGDQYWFVIRVENGDDPVRFFKQNGWYASFDGGHYEDGEFEEVSPVERTVVFYE